MHILHKLPVSLAPFLELLLSHFMGLMNAVGCCHGSVGQAGTIVLSEGLLEQRIDSFNHTELGTLMSTSFLGSDRGGIIN